MMNILKYILFFFFLVVAGYIALIAIPVQQQRSVVQLPNGYSLREKSQNVFLTGPNGTYVINEPVSQFMVNGFDVYGWVDSSKICFFLLDTRSGAVRKFSDSSKLNEALLTANLPKYDMQNDYTFWDIRSGRKKIAWEIQ